MSDLISRQAAIDAIKKKDDFTNTAIGYALGMAIHAVRDLPSAEPEPCEDAVNRANLRLMKTEECAGHTIEYAMGWKACIEWIKTLPSAQPEPLQVARDIATIIENEQDMRVIERNAQQWIPCSERLPENRRYVLVTYKYVYGLIDHGITWYGEAEKKWNTSRDVIAWMPLPEPYKEEQE